MLTTTTKYNKGLIQSANSEAKTLEANKTTGVSQLDIMGARNLLATLQNMRTKDAGQKGALTKAVNHLSHAIADAKVNPNARDFPVHPLNPPIVKIRADEPVPTGGPIEKIRADEPLPGGSGGPVIEKIRADEPLPGGAGTTGGGPGGHGGVIEKIRADEPLPGTGGHGPIIEKIRADDPVPVPSKDHDKVTATRSHELAAAFHMMKPADIKWQKGNLLERDGQQWAQVAIEDHRMTDGNAIYAYIPTGALTAPGGKKVDPNKVNEFYLQALPGGRQPTAFNFAGPFTMPKGIEVAPKLEAKAEVIGEKVAENNGHRLSKSDAVFLRGIEPLGNNKFKAKFDVTMWMDANKVNGHITATVDGSGKLLDKGTFTNVRAHDA